MIDRNKRIRTLSTKRRNVEQLTIDAVLEAMQPQEKPMVMPKADLRRQAAEAMAAYSGTVTKLPAVDPATLLRPRWKDR